MDESSWYYHNIHDVITTWISILGPCTRYNGDRWMVSWLLIHHNLIFNGLVQWKDGNINGSSIIVSSNSSSSLIPCSHLHSYLSVYDIVQLKHCVAQKSEEIPMKSMQQSISLHALVITTKMGPFLSIIQHKILEKIIWCPSKYHEMKILLPVTISKIWPESGMLTVNITLCISTFNPSKTFYWPRN